MRSRIATTLTGLALAAVSTTVAVAPASASSGSVGSGSANPECRQDQSRSRLAVVGLTEDQRLVCFNADRPGRAQLTKRISRLTGDVSLVGIDYRPATRQLYGIGNAGGIYTIDPRTAVATKKAQLQTALQGASFGIDFNPVVDRLRVISDTGQNLAVNVDDGSAVVGSALNTGPNTTSMGVTGAAYTNNDADPNTATTLFDIDTVGDQVVIQSPPNGGTLVPTGKLGVDTGSAVGFDIFSRVRGGTTQSVAAFAALTVGGKSGFYRVDLITGRASKVGGFDRQVTDIAIPVS
jgi:hypothetical protein